MMRYCETYSGKRLLVLHKGIKFSAIRLSRKYHQAGMVVVYPPRNPEHLPVWEELRAHYLMPRIIEADGAEDAILKMSMILDPEYPSRIKGGVHGANKLK